MVEVKKKKQKGMWISRVVSKNNKDFMPTLRHWHNQNNGEGSYSSLKAAWPHPYLTTLSQRDKTSIGLNKSCYSSQWLSLQAKKTIEDTIAHQPQGKCPILSFSLVFLI